MTVAERQEQLVPKDDLAPYAGLWVALRGGYVIASALDAVTLRDQPEVDDEAVLMPRAPVWRGHQRALGTRDQRSGRARSIS